MTTYPIFPLQTIRLCSRRERSDGDTTGLSKPAVNEKIRKALPRKFQINEMFMNRLILNAVNYLTYHQKAGTNFKPQFQNPKTVKKSTCILLYGDVWRKNTLIHQ